MSSHRRRKLQIMRVLVWLVRLGASGLGPKLRDTVLAHLSWMMIPEIRVSVGSHSLKFWSFGGWSIARGRTVLTKEPLTISWIDGFTERSDGAVFWDVGANVGVYTVYAAATKRVLTFAFEPSALNFAVLQKNLELNGIDNLVRSFPIALSDSSGLGKFTLAEASPGKTGGQLNLLKDKLGPVQGVLHFSIDDLVERHSFPVPHYIKIDVDGIENLILRGAAKTLANSLVKSILVEASPETQEMNEIRLMLESAGFREIASEPTIPGKETMQNYVFSR